MGKLFFAYWEFIMNLPDSLTLQCYILLLNIPSAIAKMKLKL